jgi:riboflavin kinase/FMN adenylyltransferase
MKVIRSLRRAPSFDRSVVTIGNFDGFHRGHAAILHTLVRRAQDAECPSVAITFDPHPLELLAPEHAPIALSTLDQKIALLAKSGLDVLIVERFDDAFSRLSPDQFMQTFLIDHLRARSVCVGDNFRFGHGHRGNIRTLEERVDDFEVIPVAAVFEGGEPISSSRIRQLVLGGAVSSARRLLGRSYQIDGRIVTGRGRGAKVTVPTLNLLPNNPLVPADGVYLTRMALEGGAFMDALTNVGIRPTFAEVERTVETHLLDDPLGVGEGVARLCFMRRLRDELKFPDAHALKRQIGADIAFANKFFRRLKAPRCDAGGAVFSSRSQHD